MNLTRSNHGAALAKVANERKLNLRRGFALGGQTDSQVSSQVHASLKNKHKTDYPLFHWLIIG